MRYHRPVTAARHHSANLDRLRLVAIVDIVLYHVNYFEPRYLLGMGLPTFLVTATMLGCHHTRPRPWPEVIGPRVRRIILPWLFWSLVFGIALGLRESVFNEWRVWYRPFEWKMLVYGTAIHLWFLPFIFAAGLAVRGLHVVTSRWPGGVVMVGGVAAGLAWAAVPSPADLPFPVESWWFAFPAIPLGLALGRVQAERAIGHPATLPVTLVALALSIAFLLTQGLSPPLGRFGLACSLIVLALRFPSRPDPVTVRLTPLVYGVFLIHPLVLLFVHDVTVGDPSYELLAACGLGVSAAITLLLQWTPVRRFV